MTLQIINTFVEIVKKDSLKSYSVKMREYSAIPQAIQAFIPRKCFIKIN
jgi:hypothetical protein